MSTQLFLNQTELSRRWKISPRTLERWRWLGTGPRYHKIGGRVVYRISDIEEFENSRSFTSTMDEQQGGKK
ncbi:MAG: helix-turn-helix domain-containing protein [Alphaproteobacteria bacterium]|nr:helix-turn-helix domain-containing protein [Alphaproteobacteria bacterium]